MTIVPALRPNRPLLLPEQAENTLTNGLTVIAIRRAAVPLVEVRVWVPFAHSDLAQGALLGQTLFSGAAGLSNADIAVRLQEVGGGFSAGVDPDRLLITGNGLSAGLDRLLQTLAEVLIGASYPDREVITARNRLADRLKVAHRQPSQQVRSALQERIYGTHPYHLQAPRSERVQIVAADDLRRLHTERLRPAGSFLVLVGDIDPQRAVTTAARWLEGWTGRADSRVLPPIPAFVPGALLLVDRPAAVQSSLRLALPAARRDHPDNAPLQLANLIFGGYFSSRWMENLREDKGYTYGPHSGITHSLAGSTLVAAAEVATEVTAPALVETCYELGRIACLPPSAGEVAQARQFALGSLAIGLSTQGGLATRASNLAGSGLRLEYLVQHANRLAAATVDDIHRAAATYLAPSRAVAVMLGDAQRIGRTVSAVMPMLIHPIAAQASN